MNRKKTGDLSLPDVEGLFTAEEEPVAAPPRVIRLRLAHGDWHWGPPVHVDALGETHFFLTPRHDRARAGPSVQERGASTSSSSFASAPNKAPPETAPFESERLASPLLRVSTVTRGGTVFIAVSDASAAPPYRIENRSRSVTVAVRARRSRLRATPSDTSAGGAPQPKATSGARARRAEHGALLAVLRPMSWANVAPVESARVLGTALGGVAMLSSADVFSVVVGAVPFGVEPARTASAADAFGGAVAAHAAAAGSVDVWREYSLHDVRHLRALEVPRQPPPPPPRRSSSSAFGDGGAGSSSMPSMHQLPSNFELPDMGFGGEYGLDLEQLLAPPAGRYERRAEREGGGGARRAEHVHRRAPSVLHVMVQLHERTRVLVFSDQKLDIAAETLHRRRLEQHRRRRAVANAALDMLDSTRLRLEASLAAVSLALIDESGRSGRPQELLHAAIHSVRLELQPTATFSSGHAQHDARRASEATFSIGRVQIDNLLPDAAHPVVLQCPRRREGAVLSARREGSPHEGGDAAVADGHGGGGGGGASGGGGGLEAGGGAGGGGAVGVGQEAAVRLLVRRRASGQLQDVRLELQPLDVALEASFLKRVDRLLAVGGELSARLVMEVHRLLRVAPVAYSHRLHAALEERLSAVLAAPPDWASNSSQRLPFYCDKLTIAPVDVRVSSRLDVGVGGSADVDSASTELGRSSTSDLSTIPIVAHMLQLMIVFVKATTSQLASLSKVPFYFSAFEQDFPLCTKSELLYSVRQAFSWQAAAQLGKLLGHSEMLGNPFGVIQGMGTGVAGAVRGVGEGIVRRDGKQVGGFATDRH